MNEVLEQEQQEKERVLAILEGIHAPTVEYIRERLRCDIYPERCVQHGVDAAVDANDAREILEQEILPLVPEDVRDKLYEKRNFLGAVFHTKYWTRVGFAPSRGKGHHAHHIFRWIPKAD